MSIISIIVPVYNTEKYLSECLESILIQTYSNFEIICVNDGSKDNSAAILSEYEKRDSRIKVITQENQGVSVARNAGINLSKGEYIAFLDSDDTWNSYFLEKMISAMNTKNVDFVCCGVRKLKNEKKANNDLESNLLKECVFSRFGLLVGNLVVRKKILTDNDIFFYPGCRFNEDFEFVYKILSIASERVAVIPENLYFHRQREGAATEIKWLYAHEDKLTAFNRAKEFILNHYQGNDKVEIIHEIQRNQSTQFARLLWGSIVHHDFVFAEYLLSTYPEISQGKTRKIGHSLVLWIGKKKYLWNFIYWLIGENK